MAGMDPGVHLQVWTLKFECLPGRLSVTLLGMTGQCHLLSTPSLIQEVFLEHSRWFCGSSLSSICMCVHAHVRGCTTYVCTCGGTRGTPGVLLSFLTLFFETEYHC